MRKTISLRLTSDEEDILKQIVKKGTSQTKIFREALSHYFDSVNHSVNHFQQEKNDLPVNQVVYSHKEKPVNQPVNHFQQEENDLPVNQVVYSHKDTPVSHVNQIVNHPEEYVNHYINQLNSRINQLENETNEWKNKYDNEIQYLRDSYKSLQNEYFNQTKDSIKRLDDKFDRLMFYVEESRKPSLQPMNLHGTKKEMEPDYDTIKIHRKKKTEPPKKGWVFRMYRM